MDTPTPFGVYSLLAEHLAGGNAPGALSSPAPTKQGQGPAAGIDPPLPAAVRPKLLDLFCGAGGAAMGYYRAGFDVVGVDIKPQPNYPFEFLQADISAFWFDDWVLGGFNVDVIHASPPCQAYSPLGALSPEKSYPDLIDRTRAILNSWASMGRPWAPRPWVIENVMSAPLIKERSVTLCGSMFGLRTYRHRRFESNLALVAPEHPKHTVLTATKQRLRRWKEGWNVSITGDVGTYVGPEAMGIDWMTGNELCEAIPPAYTQFIGWQILARLHAAEAMEAIHVAA